MYIGRKYTRDTYTEEVEGQAFMARVKTAQELLDNYRKFGKSTTK